VFKIVANTVIVPYDSILITFPIQCQLPSMTNCSANIAGVNYTLDCIQSTSLVNSLEIPLVNIAKINEL
jgi:hypothetical protein